MEPEKSQILNLNLENLKIISILGRGAKGVVFLIQEEGNAELLAMKVISKDFVEKKTTDDRGEFRRVCFEQRVLSSFDHPLLPTLRGVLVTEKIVGYAMDYCSGSDLNQLRKNQSDKMFSDDLIRFYAAEIVLALEYLHNQFIVYRDLKPENIMIQENGHIMLVDFDLSTKLSSKSRQTSPTVRILEAADSLSRVPSRCNSVSYSEFSSNTARTDSDYSTERSNSFVGTEDYVAPEIISGKGHDFAVDWWSLGVVLYEMLYGTTPFRGSNRKETFYKIVNKQPNLVGASTSLRDLIRKLLEKDPNQRIGIDEIKGHDFFRGVDWDSVLYISRTPYIPPLKEVVSGDTDGNKGFDMELFVQGVFSKSQNEKQHESTEEATCDSSKENEVNFWVY